MKRKPAHQVVVKEAKKVLETYGYRSVGSVLQLNIYLFSIRRLKYLFSVMMTEIDMTPKQGNFLSIHSWFIHVHTYVPMWSDDVICICIMYIYLYV